MKDWFWVDTHCHLEMIGGKIEEILQRADEKNVRRVVSIGIDGETNRLLVETAKKLPKFNVTLGMHPHEANGCRNEDLDFIRENHHLPFVIGLGESGLDYYYKRSEPKVQQEVFEKMADLAVELNMPLVLHSREAEEDTMNILRKYDGANIRFLLHCFTSNIKLAEFGWERGYYFSFNGISTFKSSESIREVLKNTPKDRILLETDSPYLAPNPHRGKKNEPAYVSLIGEYIANFLGMSNEELARFNMQNAQNFYKNLTYEN